MTPEEAQLQSESEQYATGICGPWATLAEGFRMHLEEQGWAHEEAIQAAIEWTPSAVGPLYDCEQDDAD